MSWQFGRWLSFLGTALLGQQFSGPLLAADFRVGLAALAGWVRGLT